MKLKLKKGFTLVELIVVIAIIAILAVSAGMMLTKWIGKSKDARVIADLNTIDKAMQVHYADKISYPNTSLNSKPITISGVNYKFKQGNLDEGVVNMMTSMDKTPKNPNNSDYYYYSLSDDESRYQVAGKSEDSGWIVRGNYSYAAIASGTIGTADVVELPSLFVLSDANGNSLVGTSTYVAGSTFNFIIDGRANGVGVVYKSGTLDLDNSSEVEAFHNTMTNPLNISTGALQAQLKSQVRR